MTELEFKITFLYLINIHLLSLYFICPEQVTRGAILSCRMIILPYDVISALNLQLHLQPRAFVYIIGGGCHVA